MTTQELLTLLEQEYLAKILGFAYQKVQDRTEAEELASDITLEIVKTIRKGREIENFNALVWSISNHVFFNYLRKKKHGTAMYLTELLEAKENIEAEVLKKEQENLLRREVAMLSEKYRSAVVLHYFDGKGCEEIGELLHQSAGTVKWWLHEARTSIKEGMDTMREYGEKSFKPDYLYVSCQGEPGLDKEPVSCAKRKLAQNILLAAYAEPVTIKELCVEHGVAAAYIEDELANLVENQLMKEVSRGKYQTDFVILPGDISKLQQKIKEHCFPAYYEKLMKLLEKNKELLSTGAWNRPGFTWERLLWVYLHLFTDVSLNRFRAECCKAIPFQDMPKRPHGGQWIAIGYRGGLPTDENGKKPEYASFDGPVHKPGCFAQGFFHHWSGTNSTPFFELPEELIKQCNRVLKELRNSTEASVNAVLEENKEVIAEALSWKLLTKEENKITPNYYFVEEQEAVQLLSLAQTFYEIAKPYFEQAWKMTLQEFEAEVPKALRPQMGNLLANTLNTFVSCSLYEAVEQGVLSDYAVEGREWLSMVVFFDDNEK